MKKLMITYDYDDESIGMMNRFHSKLKELKCECEIVGNTIITKVDNVQVLKQSHREPLVVIVIGDYVYQVYISYLDSFIF